MAPATSSEHGDHDADGWSSGHQTHPLAPPDALVGHADSPAADVASAANRLPVPPLRLIGRQVDLTALTERLREPTTRLVTLVGPPGVGKTSLGLAVAATIQGSFADGAVSVALTAVPAVEQVAPAIAQALGVIDVLHQPLGERLKEHLRERTLLLLLDNFEHVQPAGPLVADLLDACPGLTVVVTSRARLRIPHETAVTVAPLALPDPAALPVLQTLAQTPSVELFVNRAQAARPDFELTSANAASVAEICRRLDGLPLAIVLAAARASILTAGELLSRLGRVLPVLTRGSTELSPRHRTLRCAIAWSYELLEPPEQALFRRLAVFIDGWTLDAAEIVCGLTPNQAKVSAPTDSTAELDAVGILDGLTTLVGNSLVSLDQSSATRTRFRMFETIAEYAYERLEASGPAADMSSEAASLRARHAAYFLELAEQAEPYLVGRHQVEHLDHLETELGNIRSALAWSRAGGAGSAAVDMGLRLATALWRFWELRGHVTEGWQWLADLTALQPEPTVARARALNVAGYLAWLRGDMARAIALTQECLALGRTLGDAVALGWGLIGAGILAIMTDDPRQAATLLDEALDVVGPNSHYHARITALYWRSELARTAGHEVRAERLLDDAMRLARSYDDVWMLAFMLLSRACTQLERGTAEDTDAAIGESLTIRREIGDVWGIVGCVEAAGWACAVQGAPERAARLFGAAEALRERVGVGHLPALRANYDRAVTMARSQLSPARFSAAWTHGRTLSRDGVIDEILVSSRAAVVLPPPATTSGRAAAPSHGPSAVLTRRERQVAVLIGMGLTSRQIAEQLVIAERTVDAHAEHIRAKLGLHSRAQIAAWAIANGLAGPTRD